MREADDYWILKDELGFGNALVLKTPLKRKFVSVISRHKIKIIRLNEYLGWRGRDLAFLTQIPSIEGVDVISNSVTDLSPIFRLLKIKTLSLTCPAKVAGDFGKLSALRSVFLTWRDVYESLFKHHGLLRININDYPDCNLARWAPSPELRDLRLCSSSLVSLCGIDRFPAIDQLRLFSCRKLSSLDAISSAKPLTRLRIDRCSRIRDLSPLSDLTELREFEVEDCGEILSLLPIAKCRKLESLQVAGNTTVLDGDFKKLKTLPHLKRVLLAQRKHYTLTAEDLERC